MKIEDVDVVLSDPFGQRLEILDTLTSAEYARALHIPGQAIIEFPDEAYDPSLFRIDGRLEFWRQVAPGRRVLDTDTSFLIRRRRRVRRSDGGISRVVGGPSAVDILRRYIVAYAAGASEAVLSSVLSDDAMKLIVRQNLADTAPADRKINAAYFTVAANDSLGSAMSKKFSRRNVLEVLKEISDNTLPDTNPIFFDVVRSGDTSFEFRTYAGQRGTNRLITSASPITFSAAHGNLAEEDLDEIYDEEVTNVYAGGAGEKDNRLVRTASDAIRSARSPFGRHELWVDARDSTKTSEVDDDANAALIAGRPRRVILGTLLSTEQAKYGRDWTFGDKVGAEVFGVSMEVWINAIGVRWDSDGKQTVTAKVEGIDLNA